MKTWAFVAAAAALFGCSEDNFDPGYRVTTTRILAVQANLPYAAPGEEISLEALGHDHAGRPITWAWATCPNPTSATPSACLAKIGEDARQSGKPSAIHMGEGESRFTFKVPDDALSSLPEGARAGAMVGVAVVACPGTLSLAEGDVVPVRCTDASGQVLPLEAFDIGVKRIFVRARDRNANPVFADVSWDGAPWPENEVKEVKPCDDASKNDYEACDGDKHRIAAHVTKESYESGTDEHGARFDEQLVAQYYATEGIFESSVRRADSPETGFVARKGASGSTVTLWFVVRDDRGGVSWATRSVRVR